MSLCFRTWIYI